MEFATYFGIQSAEQTPSTKSSRNILNCNIITILGEEVIRNLERSLLESFEEKSGEWAVCLHPPKMLSLLRDR